MNQKINQLDKLSQWYDVAPDSYVTRLKKQLGVFTSYKDVVDFVPRSVWNINSRTKEIKELFEDDLEKHVCKRNEGYAVAIEQKFSVFNPHLGIEILKIWSNIGDRVIDPFAGRDRALITNFMDRHYTGFEISKKTFNQVEKKIKAWKHLNKKFECKMINGDGTDLFRLDPDSFDFCYSCPPYWSKEKYESCKGQLSDIKTEKEWREAISRTAVSLRVVLKKNAYAVFVIADIRDKGRMIPLHSHWIEEFISDGWNLKDIIINQTNPMNCSGINGFLKNRIMWKTHEYVLVFKNTK